MRDSPDEKMEVNNKVSEIQNTQNVSGVSKTVELDVVELLKQVLQWTPLYRPGLNKALIQAAKIGSAGCVKVLLSTGADIDTEDENGDTPFVHAFRSKFKDVMQVLRDAGCQTEIAKMSLALATKDVDFIKFCHRLEIPVENEDWNTNSPDEVKILLEDLQLDPFKGQYGYHGYEDSPFMYISQEGKPEILELMISHHPSIDKYTPEDRQNKINRALHKAIKHRRLDNVKFLVRSLGAHLDYADSQGRTALLIALGHDETISQFIVDLGADVYSMDRQGLSALHWAACSGFKNLCSKLLDKQLDINSRGKQGATPLMVACSNRHKEILELFVNRGCDVNATTPEGWTALHVAVRACSASVVKRLLLAGADPNVASTRLTHNSDVVPASTPLLIAIALNSMKIIRHLFDANVDINHPGTVCLNPSFSSSESEEESKIIEKQKCWPIQYAILSRAWDICSLLIKAGSDITPIRKWVEENQSPVTIPPEKLMYFKILINNVISSPPKLRQLSRRKIRKLLGRQLLNKLQELALQPQTRQFLLCHELFRPTGGSFEV